MDTSTVRMATSKSACVTVPSGSSRPHCEAAEPSASTTTFALTDDVSRRPPTGRRPSPAAPECAPFGPSPQPSGLVGPLGAQASDAPHGVPGRGDRRVLLCILRSWRDCDVLRHVGREGGGVRLAPHGRPCLRVRHRLCASLSPSGPGTFCPTDICPVRSCHHRRGAHVWRTPVTLIQCVDALVVPHDRPRVDAVRSCAAVCFTIYKGFPLRKAPFYILSQLLGGFVAVLCAYGIFNQQFKEIYAALEVAAPAQIYSPSGPAGVLALFPAPGQELRWAFLNEFIANIFLSILVFSVLDLCKCVSREPLSLLLGLSVGRQPLHRRPDLSRPSLQLLRLDPHCAIHHRSRLLCVS